MINTLLKPVIRFIPENNRWERIWKLAQVDFKKRYYNDRLGLFWALLNPLFQIMIYFFVFKYVFKVPTENYGIFLFAGMIMWMFFAEIAQKGLAMIRSKKYLLENIQFNKMDLFYSTMITGFLGFFFNLVAFTIICHVLGIYYSWTFLKFPILLINVIMIGLGVSMILATIQIFFKDIVHAWSIVMLFGFWTSGVFFRAEKFLEIFPPILYIHPFNGIIINMRNITMGLGEWNYVLMVVDLAWGFLLFFLGRYLFLKYSSKGIELM